VSSDRLYPLADQAELAEGIPRSVSLRVIDSPYGHDGFLIEAASVSALLAGLLAAGT
jgi:homoserine O-acetyltransferase/O-succinyltransferase